jgi:hypothetical protein
MDLGFSSLLQSSPALALTVRRHHHPGTPIIQSEAPEAESSQATELVYARKAQLPLVSDPVPGDAAGHATFRPRIEGHAAG